MVVAEIAAALVLLLATIVLVQNLRRLHDLHPGFNPDGVFQARVSIPPAYRSPEDLARFYERLSDRLAASPGVEQVGVISVAPLSGLLATVPFSVAGLPHAERDAPSANLRAISPGYPSAAGTRLLRRPVVLGDRPVEHAARGAGQRGARRSVPVRRCRGQAAPDRRQQRGPEADRDRRRG